MIKAQPRPRRRPVIRLFVSSTFSDMKHERNALQEDVFPKLEQLCLQDGFQFQAIDLRWGISTEVGLDHRTMRVCLDELHRAREISPRPNFLILLGNRYGWQPLPEEITPEEFDALRAAASGNPDHLRILHDWYRLDTNACPALRLLRSRRESPDARDYTQDAAGRDTAAWTEVQNILWSLINRVYPPDTLAGRFAEPVAPDRLVPPMVRFQASATEQEIWHGALRVPDAPEHVLAFFREIANTGEFPDPMQIKDFVDVDSSGEVDVKLKAAQELLKDELRRRLGAPNVSEARTDLRDCAEKQSAVDIRTDHLEQLRNYVERRLTEIIRRQIGDYWEQTTQASPERILRELKIEQDEHERFGRERGSEASFVGRQAELKAIIDYVENDSCWPLVIHGASGCGKTSLLARAAQEVARTRQPIVRFIGVQPRSSDLESLLSSLCQELRLRHPREGAPPTEIKFMEVELQDQFMAAPPEQPLILFLDALDQLSDANHVRLLYWLPAGPLPMHVKLVVSCLSDRAPGDPAGHPYAELRRRGIPAGNFINLDKLSEDEARRLLFDCWLPQSRRTLTGGQRACIERHLASAACRQPIYLKLLFEETRLWRSYDAAPEIGEDVPALLDQLFVRLSRPTSHGPILVDRVLSYLALSRQGLTENEILEILFADPEYKAALARATETTRHDIPPTATRIPTAIWSRLRFDLDSYLTERAGTGANVLAFYHDQFREAVKGRYARDANKCRLIHKRLSAYFRCKCDPHGDGTWQGNYPHGSFEFPFQFVKSQPTPEECDLLFAGRMPADVCREVCSQAALEITPGILQRAFLTSRPMVWRSACAGFSILSRVDTGECAKALANALGGAPLLRGLAPRPRITLAKHQTLMLTSLEMWLLQRPDPGIMAPLHTAWKEKLAGVPLLGRMLRWRYGRRFLAWGAAWVGVAILRNVPDIWPNNAQELNKSFGEPVPELDTAVSIFKRRSLLASDGDSLAGLAASRDVLTVNVLEKILIDAAAKQPDLVAGMAQRLFDRCMGSPPGHIVMAAQSMLYVMDRLLQGIQNPSDGRRYYKQFEAMLRTYLERDERYYACRVERRTYKATFVAALLVQHRRWMGTGFPPLYHEVLARAADMHTPRGDLLRKDLLQDIEIVGVSTNVPSLALEALRPIVDAGWWNHTDKQQAIVRRIVESIARRDPRALEKEMSSLPFAAKAISKDPVTDENPLQTLGFALDVEVLRQPALREAISDAFARGITERSLRAFIAAALLNLMALFDPERYGNA